MKEIRVLHLIDSIGLGGAQRILQGLMRIADDHLFQTGFALRKNINEMDLPHVEVFDSFRRFSFAPIRNILNIIERERIGILHCHLIRSQVFGWIIKRFFLKKLILVFHEHGQIHEGKSGYGLLLRAFSPRVDLFVAPTVATKALLISHCGVEEAKIKIVPSFIFQELECLDRTTNRKALGLGENEFIMGFIGRLDPEKGCACLIRSLPYLDFDYKLIIAGDGSQKRYLEAMAKKTNHADPIKFLGYVRDVREIYCALDLLIIPSLRESFPLSALEAQSAAVPIIASRVGGLPELIGEEKSGLLFSPGDEKELAQKIALLRHNGKLRNELALCGKRNSRNYSFEKISLEYLKIYHSFSSFRSQ